MNNIESQLHELEVQVTSLSDEVLKQQEHHHVQAIEQLKQSVAQVAEGNEFVLTDNDPSAVVDPNCIPGKISEFSQLTEILKVTHLEQESLDNFLRYTISSGDLAQLESVNDEKYVSLNAEIENLRENVIEGLNTEIDKQKLHIIQSSQNIAEKRKLVNETCLEITNLLEDCWKLASELEQLNGEQIDEHKEMQDNTLEITNALWESLQEQTIKHSQLEARLKILTSTRNSLERVQAKQGSGVNLDGSMKEACDSYQRLCDFWQNSFVNAEIKNLKVYPQSNRLQFECLKMDIIITLNDFGIYQINVYDNNIPDVDIHNIRKNIEQLKSRSDFYLSIRKIIDIVKNHAKGTKEDYGS
ncbi:LAFE_0G00716g1_1 [Lachancea fermentati]|uniref:Spindle pole body component KRE28 n=1 Tax=Lachancea fermentati TaxID=4955 RepID=A0A1G4MGN4_LACFM|nr:LAFE_0G00716g1_1 [Lachancea fermentati]